MVFLSLLEEQNSLCVVRQEDMDGDSSDDQLTRHSNDSGDDAQPSKQAAQLWRCDNIVCSVVYLSVTLMASYACCILVLCQMDKCVIDILSPCCSPITVSQK